MTIFRTRRKLASAELLTATASATWASTFARSKIELGDTEVSVHQPLKLREAGCLLRFEVSLLVMPLFQEEFKVTLCVFKLLHVDGKGYLGSSMFDWRDNTQ